MASNRIFLSLATVMGFSLIMGLAVLVILVRTADEMPTPTPAVIILAAPTLDATASPSATITPTATLTTTPTVVATLPTTYPAPCAYAWAHQDLPDITAITQAALDTAGITQTSVRVEAFGENCIDGTTGKIRSFGAMTTDFYFTVTLDDVSDETVLAALVKPLYNIGAAIPRDDMPAPPGYFDVTFASTATALHLRTRFDEAQIAIERDLKGERLLDALGGLTVVSG
jgi:hypothetical protein